MSTDNNFICYFNIIMTTGTIKFFDQTKGFGFIKNDETGEDIFVHIHDVAEEDKDTLDDGDRVTYTVGEGRKGPQAQEVSKIEGEEEGGKVIQMEQADDLQMAA